MDFGEAKYWINKAEKVLQKKLKMKIFYGTLNIKLKEEYKIGKGKFIINSKEYGGTQKLFLNECKVLGNKAFILRTEKNESGKGDHPLNVIEVISKINFREKYDLKDGDEIDIEIN